jgi:hypothetical protein
MLQRNEIIFDYLLLSRIFLDLTADNLQKMIDNMLLSQFLGDLAAGYRVSLNKSSIVTNL